MSTPKPLIILYIHKPPYPYDTGTNQRIKALVAHLRTHYRLGLVVPRTNGPVEDLKRLFDSIWVGEQRDTYADRIMSRLGTYLKKTWLWQKLKISGIHNPLAIIQVAAAWRLWQVCRDEKPALIMVQKVFNTVPATAIARHFGIPVVLDVHDLYRLGQKTRFERFPDATTNDEKALLREYDLLIAIQHEDARNLKQHLPTTPVVLAMHPVEAASLPKQETIGGKRLLFIGSASRHNLDAIQSFILHAFPSILEQHPDTVLEICGSVAGEIAAGTENDRVLLTGSLPDLAAAYARATLVINPIRAGSGLKIKTVEGIAYGKCVVTTHIGAEGIEDADKVLAVVSVELFHEKVNALLHAPELIRKQENAALEYAAAHLTPEACYAGLVNQLNLLLEGNP